jgi:hypothetical protein
MPLGDDAAGKSTRTRRPQAPRLEYSTGVSIFCARDRLRRIDFMPVPASVGVGLRPAEAIAEPGVDRIGRRIGDDRIGEARRSPPDLSAFGRLSDDPDGIDGRAPHEHQHHDEAARLLH